MATLNTLADELFMLVVVHRLNLKANGIAIDLKQSVSITHDQTAIPLKAPLLAAHWVFLHHMQSSLTHVLDDVVFNSMSVTEYTSEPTVRWSVGITSEGESD